MCGCAGLHASKAQFDAYRASSSISVRCSIPLLQGLPKLDAWVPILAYKLLP